MNSITKLEESWISNVIPIPKKILVYSQSEIPKLGALKYKYKINIILYFTNLHSIQLIFYGSTYYKTNLRFAEKLTSQINRL